MQYPHWQYYLSLVDDVDRISRYVDLTADNYATYSTELTRILLTAGSEIDVVAKLLCYSIDPGSKPNNIIEYGRLLLPKYSGLTSVEVSIARTGLSFVPWFDWSNTQAPMWWTNYNKVKHERNAYFKEANLCNVLNAVAGLCVFVCYLHYYDFISGGLNIRRPFFYLDTKYNADSHILCSPETKLPDFVNETKLESAS